MIPTGVEVYWRFLGDREEKGQRTKHRKKGKKGREKKNLIRVGGGNIFRGQLLSKLCEGRNPGGPEEEEEGKRKSLWRPNRKRGKITLEKMPS